MLARISLGNPGLFCIVSFLLASVALGLTSLNLVETDEELRRWCLIPQLDHEESACERVTPAPSLLKSRAEAPEKTSDSSR